MLQMCIYSLMIFLLVCSDPFGFVRFSPIPFKRIPCCLIIIIESLQKKLNLGSYSLILTTFSVGFVITNAAQESISRRRLSNSVVLRYAASTLFSTV